MVCKTCRTPNRESHQHAISLTGSIFHLGSQQAVLTHTVPMQKLAK